MLQITADVLVSDVRHQYRSDTNFDNATFATLLAHQYRRLQSVLNDAARLIYRPRRFDHVTLSLLRDLHWLKVPERVAKDKLKRHSQERSARNGTESSGGGSS